MTRFQVVTKTADGGITYVLRDMQSGARACIVPWSGANCMELSLAVGSGDPLLIIDDMQFTSLLGRHTSRYGIPILFPWPSGINAGTFMFQNKLYPLNGPGNKGSKHHGYVNNVPWRVLRSDCDNGAAWLTCAIDSSACGEMAARFPSSFKLEVTWRLTPEGFQIILGAQNTGKTAMPLGMGLHPYFTIPFGKKGTRQTCRLAAQVARQWDLKAIVATEAGGAKPNQTFLPQPTFTPVEKTGTLLQDVQFNHVFEARFDDKAITRATIIDPANQVKVLITASKDFGTWVFYNPPDRSAISLEPWTLAPNGFNLAAAGISEAGMKVLQPGEKWSGQVGINCENG